MTFPQESSYDAVFWYRWQIEQVPKDDFLEVVGDEELLAAKMESAWWPDAVFTAGNSPYDAAAAEHAFHIGEVDLLRHRYRTMGLDLEVFESAAVVLTWVDAPLPPEPMLRLHIQHLAASLFRLGNAPLYFFAGATDESLRFSPYPQKFMGGVGRQIDGGIVGGRLFFMDYKYGLPGKAVGLPPTSTWLGPTLRATWEAWPRR